MTAIRVELQLADGTFTSGMLRAGQSVEGFRRALMEAHPHLAKLEANGVNVVRQMTQVDGSTKGFLATLRDVSLVTGLVSMGISKMTAAANGWVGEIVRINAQMERLTYQMKAMSTSADPMKEAGENVKYLREQAAQMPFSLKTITSSFVKLKATGTDPMNGSLRSIADGIAAFGGDDHSLERTILGITQASGKGVLQMEELRQQIGESMPIAMQLLARSMGLTIGELAKEIQTGTVASRPALEMLYKELDRAYGGTSQRMMQTFTGQLTQLHTNFQNLATSEGGKGFFDQVKSQLKDINQFLSGDMAKKMAVSVGSGLESVVTGLRSALEMAWDFREELQRLAVVAAGGIGFLALARGVGTFTTALSTSVIALRVMKTNMVEAWSNIALGATGFKNLGTTMIGTQFIATGLGGAIKAATVGLVGMAPLIATIGMAAYAASEYFGLLSDKVNDAYEALKKYGAETRKDASDTISAKRKQLEDRIISMREIAKMASPGAWDADIADTIKQLEELNRIAPKLQEDAGKRESAKALDNFRDQVSDLVDEKQRLYRDEQAERDKKYDADLAATGKNEALKFELRKKYEEETLAAQKKLSEDIIAVYDKQRAALEDQISKADEVDKKSLQGRLAFVNELRISEFNRLKELDTYKFGAPKTTSGANDAKNVERGQQALENLQRDIAGLQANLEGASGAAAEMNEKISSGDYGAVKETGDEVEILHKKLMAAAEAKEQLDKVMKSNQKADNDIKRIREQLDENWADLEERKNGRKLNPFDKMGLKLNREDEAGYFGLGSAEKIKRDIGDVVSRMNVQGETANRIGQVMRENAFGEETVRQIDYVATALDRLTGKIEGIGSAIGDVDFSRLGQTLPAFEDAKGSALAGTYGFSGTPSRGGNLMSSNMGTFGDPRSAGWKEKNITSIMASNGMTAQVNKLAAASFKGFLDELIGQGYNVKSLGGYALRQNVNAKGRLSEHAFGNAIDINPAQNPNGKNLVTDMPANIRELAAKWGLTWGGDFNRMKDAMHFEWRGGNNKNEPQSEEHSKSSSTIFQPVNTTVLDSQIKKTEDLKTQIADGSKEWNEWVKAQNDQSLVEWAEKAAKETEALGEDAEKAGTRVTQLRKAIVDGQFGTSEEDRNPMADRYKQAFAAAEAFDKKQKQVSETEKLSSQNKRDMQKLEEDRLEVNRRLAEAQKQLKDPHYKEDSNALQELITRMDSYVDRVKELYKGRENTSEGKSAILQAENDRRSAIASLRNLEATESQVAFQKTTRDLQNSLLTQSQLRQQSMQEDFRRVDAWVAEQRKAGMDEVEITRMAEEQKALLRQKYAAAASPMEKQFQEWGDLQTNLANASAKWMDSMAGGISDLIMGTGDLRSVLQGILKDIVNMGVKFMMSKMFSKGGAQASGGKGGKGGGSKMAASVATGGKSKFGTAHTGGIIGSSSLVPKLASSSVFSGAPKFHTGGIVGGLLPSEVPIIAKKGEGVFTPEQMSAMGGFSQAQQFNVSSNITVNGSSGTPEQNDDLAKKMAREYEASVRTVVADEIRKQTKVGNYMNQRSR